MKSSARASAEYCFNKMILDKWNMLKFRKSDVFKFKFIHLWCGPVFDGHGCLVTLDLVYS